MPTCPVLPRPPMSLLPPGGALQRALLAAFAAAASLSARHFCLQSLGAAIAVLSLSLGQLQPAVSGRHPLGSSPPPFSAELLAAAARFVPGARCLCLIVVGALAPLCFLFSVFQHARPPATPRRLGPPLTERSKTLGLAQALVLPLAEVCFGHGLDRGLPLGPASVDPIVHARSGSNGARDVCFGGTLETTCRARRWCPFIVIAAGSRALLELDGLWRRGSRRRGSDRGRGSDRRAGRAGGEHRCERVSGASSVSRLVSGSNQRRPALLAFPGGRENARVMPRLGPRVQGPRPACFSANRVSPTPKAEARALA